MFDIEIIMRINSDSGFRDASEWLVPLYFCRKTGLMKAWRDERYFSRNSFLRSALSKRFKSNHDTQFTYLLPSILQSVLYILIQLKHFFYEICDKEAGKTIKSFFITRSWLIGRKTSLTVELSNAGWTRYAGLTCRQNRRWRPLLFVQSKIDVTHFNCTGVNRFEIHWDWMLQWLQLFWWVAEGIKKEHHTIYLLGEWHLSQKCRE